MTYWIVNWSVKFRRVLVVLAAGFLIVGLIQVDDVKRDILPEFGPVTVEVQTEALGLSAQGVEQLITVPLEQDLLNGVAFLDEIESASLPGLSSVVMTFEPGTDLLDARQVVTERLTQAAGLPQVADPPQMIQPLSATSRVAMVSLRSSEVTPIEMSVLARWVMLPRLLGVDGVANVAIWGFRDQQLQVLVDPSELARQNVTLSQIISTAGNALEVSPLSFLEASLPGTGGFIDTVNQRLHVFHEQAINTAEELAEVTVEGIEGGAVFVNGEPLALGEVAEIVTDHQPLIGDAQCAAGPCILLVIEKFPDANTPAVAEGVDEALAALSLGLPGIEIDSSIYQPAEYIAAATSNLNRALLIGGILALVALAWFLRSWRIVVIALATVALSLLVAGLVLLVFGFTVDAMIVAGLVTAAFVIAVDAVMATWDAGGAVDPDVAGQGKGIAAVVDSILRMRSAAIFSALIVAAGIVSVIAMEGEAGAFLEPMALAYLLALAAGLLVSLTVAPALSVLLFEGGGGLRSSPPVDRVRNTYRTGASSWIGRSGIALVVLAVFVGAGIVAVLTLTPSLRPALQERDVLVHIEAAPGTSLDQMDEITADLVAALQAQEGIANVGAHVGRAIMSDQIVNVNSAEIWLAVDDSADYGGTIDDIESIVAAQGDIDANVTTYSEQRIDAILDGPADGVVVRVYGESPAIREEMAEQVRAAMAGVAGVENPQIELAAEEQIIEVEVDLASAQAFGIKPGDVRRQAATLVSGLVVGNLFDDQKVFDVVVWGTPEIRDTVEDIRLLPIATPSGDQVPLGDVANVQVATNPAVIRHESTATFTDVAATVSGRSVDAAAAEVDAALKAMAFPLEHHAEVLGGFAERSAAQTRVLVTALAGLILIYLLLQAAFASWRLATLALVMLPLGITGSLIATRLMGSRLTLGAIAGTVAIFAISTYLVVAAITGLRRRQRIGEAFGAELVIDEVGRNVVPLVASLAAVGLIALPLAVGGARLGLEIVAPAAIAVLGGLVTTAVLVLIVAPTLYARWGEVVDPEESTDDLLTPQPRAAATTGGAA